MRTGRKSPARLVEQEDPHPPRSARHPSPDRVGPRERSDQIRKAWWVRVLYRSAATLVLLWSAQAIAAPQAELWRKWQAHDDASTAGIDHSRWDRFLQTYVRVGQDGIARLPYAGVSKSDRDALSADLSRLAALPISAYSRREQFAFWVDLYNELTIRLVLDHYPVSSIRDIAISPGLFSAGPWGKKLIAVEGEPLGLDDIEHRILRPLWRDPRVHYAVNCAALGCPNLQPSAFTAANSEALLEKAARDYVNHPRGAAVGAGGLAVSSIYIWYQTDFGGGEAGVIEHLKHYARPQLAAALAGITRISADRYDWMLNDLRE
jgi:hypothetical protein